MTQYFSDKLRVLSFFSIILVLYMHSDFHDQEIEGMLIINSLQKYISDKIGGCAVPLFYIISGYLFFSNSNGMLSILGKMKKRVRTLLVPYFIGCSFFVIFIAIVMVIPGSLCFMNSSVVSIFSLPLNKFLLSVFYDAGSGVPLAFQLWFLRDLILIVASAPLWYLLLKKTGWYSVIIIGVMTYIKIYSFPVCALFWFMLGGQLVKYEECLMKKSNSGAFVFGLFLAVSLVELVFSEIINSELFNLPIIMVGIVGIWFLYDVIVGKDFLLENKKTLALSCRFTFFIYLFHEPTLNVVRKFVVIVLGSNEIGYILSYLFSPWLFTICAIVVASYFRKYCGRVYCLFTGGR